MDLSANRDIGTHSLDLLTFLRHRQAENLRCAIVTIIDFIGSSPRLLGSHMIVCENGYYAGSVSSGCFDANVAAFALKSIEEGQQQKIRLGEGSPFVDIKLPCGGGIELLIIPDPAPSAINNIVDVLSQRNECSALLTNTGLHFVVDAKQTGQTSEGFYIRYQPKLKIIAAGRGEELNSMVKASIATGFEVLVCCPDEDDLVAFESYGANIQHLTLIDGDPMIKADPWTAVVLLFHDHEWEPRILFSALQSDAFYIGALGSRQTHANRLDTLRLMGVGEADLRRISGPIGLVASVRNTSMLAISALAEIIDIVNKGT